MSSIEIDKLKSLLQAVEPAVLLVPPRLLRRIIKYDCGLTGLGLQVPHRKSYVIQPERLLKLANRAELGLDPDAELPATLILLVQPYMPSAQTRLEILQKYWRILFHARVHVALEERFRTQPPGDTGLNERIAVIGSAEFEEIRAVLLHDQYLLPPYDYRSTYEEFLAVYLELRYFAGDLLARYFPGMGGFERIDELASRDVDGAALFLSTQPAGVDAPAVPEDCPDEQKAPQAQDQPTPEGEPNLVRCEQLLYRAQLADARGNTVRAAISCLRAACHAPRTQQAETADRARAQQQRLVARLMSALELPAADAEDWERALAPLFDRATDGFWPVEARLLYDLQKVCIDHERQMYAIDLAEWAISFGRRRLKRPLPCQRQVLQMRHLHSAARRLKAARLTDSARQALGTLFQAAICTNEERLRTSFRPLIAGTLAGVDMHPRNLPERVALNKLVEEMLDRIIGRGFLTMSDLRDAISGNDLKLPDLGAESDRLIRANRRLPLALDGVYRRGEVYMRWLQRLSSVAFGSPAGRFLTRYVVLPFGGAFVILEGLDHVIGPLIYAITHVRLHLVLSARVVLNLGSHPWRIRVPVSVPLVGFFVLALLYMPGFRRHVVNALGLIYKLLHALLVDLPALVLGLPWMRAVLGSAPVILLRRFVFKPLLFAAPIGALLWATVDLEAALWAAGAVFLMACLLFNTRLGRTIEEALIDWAVRAWQHLHFDLLPGLFRFVMNLFKRFLEGVDRILYRVDEWLRFRSGDSRLAMVIKPVLGLGWFCISYVVRFFVNLIVEPQINPIKHFPVVTVSHKLVLGFFVRPFARFLRDVVMMEHALARTVALTVGSMIPGIFGFLVWELKENWRLYQANRAPTLGPIIIGHHGETMLRLLRPGFHSGTLPKLYARLRHAERTAHRTGHWKGARKQREALHHVEESVRHFVERAFVFLLNQSKRWGPAPLHAGTIELGISSIRVNLHCPLLAPERLQLRFEVCAGWLVVSIVHPGWLPLLTMGQQQALAEALAGLYKMAGVDLVRDQIEAGLESTGYTIIEAGLIFTDRSGVELICDPRDGRVIEAGTNQTTSPDRWPCAPIELVFRLAPIPWSDWVETWHRDQSGDEMPHVSGLVAARAILPTKQPATETLENGVRLRSVRAKTVVADGGKGD